MFNFFIYIAQTGLGQIGEGDGLGPFSKGSGTPGVELASIVSKVVGIITVAGGIWFLIQLLVGAFKWINSGGDKNNLDQARDHLTNAIISLGIMVAAYVLAGLFGIIFGLDVLNPQNILGNLKF